jgi:hypothetical protein
MLLTGATVNQISNQFPADQALVGVVITRARCVQTPGGQLQALRPGELCMLPNSMAEALVASGAARRAEEK